MRAARMSTASAAPAACSGPSSSMASQGVIEADLAGRVASQQGLDRLAGPGRAQFFQQSREVPGVVEADVADGPSGGGRSVLRAHLA